MAPTFNAAITEDETISPKVELVFLEADCLFKFSISLTLMFLYISPLIKADKICEKNKIAPIVALPSNIVPTVPIINIGPELEQNADILKACERDISPFSYKSAVILEPTG